MVTIKNKQGYIIQLHKITDNILRFRADHLSSDLVLRDISVESLHGNREQSDREKALKNFKTGMFRTRIGCIAASLSMVPLSN